MDARVERTLATVMRTATELLVEGGPTAVTIDAIVTRSGVAKSTIYRHWESRDEVLLSVMEHCAPSIDPPDDSLAFEAALRWLAGEFRRTLSDPEWARVLPALLDLRSHEDGVAALERRLEAHQDHAIEAVLRRGIDEGRLDADLDLDEAAALLVGPFMFANLMGRPEVDERFSDQVVDAFLRTYAT